MGPGLPLAQGEDEFDLACVLAELTGDFDGGEPAVCEVVDLAGEWVSDFAAGLGGGGLGSWLRDGLLETIEAFVRRGDELLKAEGLAVEPVGDELGEFFGVVHDGGERGRAWPGSGLGGRSRA